MYLLIPGRHQLITQFQFDYISSIIQNGFMPAKDLYGNPLHIPQPLEAIIFPVSFS